MRTPILPTVALISILLGPAVASAQAGVPSRRGVLAIDSRRPIDRAALSAAYAEGIGEPFGLEGLVIIVDACGPDPERYFDEALLAYALAPRPGEMVDDAIAWLICLDPPEGRFARSINNRYGTYLDPATIELAMVDPIAAGDLGTAAAEGIAAVEELLERAPRPRPATGEEEVAPEISFPRPDGRTLAAAAVLTALVGWAWRRRRRSAALAARAPASKDLRKLRSAADEVSARLLGDSAALTQLLAACEPLGETTRVALLRRHESMSRRSEELKRQVEALEGRYSNRPDGGTDSKTIDSERTRLESLLVEADALLGYAERLDRELRHAGELHERADHFIEQAKADVVEARGAYSRAAAPLADDPALKLPDAFEATALAESRIAAALRALSEGRKLQAGRRAEDASEIATRAARAAGSIARGAARVERARSAFEVASEHAVASWWDVRGHGAEAQESLALAVELFRAIIHAPEARLGDDPAAGFVTNVARLDAEIARSITLCDMLEARLADIEAARAQVESAIEPVRDAIAALDGSGASGDSGAVERARRALADAERSARATPPDWVAARHALLVADRAAEEATVAMDGPPESSTRSARLRERLAALRAARRRRIDLAQGDAEAEVGRAERLMAAHAGEIGPRAARRVEDARAALDLAIEAARRAGGNEAGRPGEEAIAAFRLAGEIAGDAMRRLRDAFERVEAPLSPSVPRRAGGGDVAPIPVKARRSPFPARFGDWGDVRPAAPTARKGRWGARRPEGVQHYEMPGW